MVRWVLKQFSELTAQELYMIMQLRSEVFVVEQNCPYLDADGKDFVSWHLCGYVEDKLAAYARLVPSGVSYQEPSIGRVVTSPEYRRAGFGKLLMEEAITQCEKLFGRAALRIGAQAYLKKFYEGFSFIDMNEPYLEDGIPHLIMLRPTL